MTIQFPKKFKGLYTDTEKKYRPLIEEAIERSKQFPIDDELRPLYSYLVWENPLPTFILSTVMFLEVAEETGGIKKGHLDYLPLLIIILELMGIADDSIDRTIMRSNRMSCVKKYGDGTTLAFTGSLMTMLFSESRKYDSKLFDQLVICLSQIFFSWVWESQNVYPKPSLFKHYVNYRYKQGWAFADFVFNASLIINKKPILPLGTASPNYRINKVAQDVDDVVNIAEFRANRGENDDLLMGIMTRPTMVAIKEEPHLLAEILELWSHFRDLIKSKPSVDELHKRHAEITRQVLPDYQKIRNVILEKGIPKVITTLLKEYHEAVKSSPPHVRRSINEIGYAYIDRLSRIDYTALQGDRHTLDVFNLAIKKILTTDR